MAKLIPSAQTGWRHDDYQVQREFERRNIGDLPAAESGSAQQALPQQSGNGVDPDIESSIYCTVDQEGKGVRNYEGIRVLSSDGTVQIDFERDTDQLGSYDLSVAPPPEYPFRWEYNPSPGAEQPLSTASPLTSLGLTVVPFNTAVYAQDTVAGSGTVGWKWVPPVAGYYHVSLMIQVVADPTPEAMREQRIAMAAYLYRTGALFSTVESGFYEFLTNTLSGYGDMVTLQGSDIVYLDPATHHLDARVNILDVDPYAGSAFVNSVSVLFKIKHAYIAAHLVQNA